VRWRLAIEAWRFIKAAIKSSQTHGRRYVYHIDVEQDPDTDPHKNKKLDPDPHQNEKMDKDLH
jgi:hypothetical protein